MTARTWFSPKQGDTTTLIVMDIRAWTDFEIGYVFHDVDDANQDTGDLRDFSNYDEAEWRLVFSGSIGGAEITGATCYGGTLAEVAVNGDAKNGELRISMPESKTGALMTYLETLSITRRGVLYANLVGVESGKKRPQFWAKVHLQFRTKAAA